MQLRCFGHTERELTFNFEDIWQLSSKKVTATIECAGNSRGKAAAVLYSIMASAKTNQIEPFAYVCDLPTQLSRNKPPASASLLPDVMRAS